MVENNFLILAKYRWHFLSSSLFYLLHCYETFYSHVISIEMPHNIMHFFSLSNVQDGFFFAIAKQSHIYLIWVGWISLYKLYCNKNDKNSIWKKMLYDKMYENLTNSRFIEKKRYMTAVHLNQNKNFRKNACWCCIFIFFLQNR